jgi:spermidine synthase
MGDYAGAVTSFERALRIAPDRADVRSDLAVALVKLGRVEEGLGGIERLIEAGEANAEVYAFMADRAFASGRPDEAARHYRETLRLDAIHSAATNNLAWLLATSRDPSVRNPDEAVLHAERGAHRGASDPGVLDTLAAAYAAAGRYGDAVRTASDARALVRNGSPQALELDSRLELYRDGQALFE